MSTHYVLWAQVCMDPCDVCQCSVLWDQTGTKIVRRRVASRQQPNRTAEHGAQNHVAEWFWFWSRCCLLCSSLSLWLFIGQIDWSLTRPEDKPWKNSCATEWWKRNLISGRQHTGTKTNICSQTVLLFQNSPVSNNREGMNIYIRLRIPSQ